MMSDTEAITTTLSRGEFELLVRESVHREIEGLLRQIVREELARFMTDTTTGVVNATMYEGPDDPKVMKHCSRR